MKMYENHMMDIIKHKPLFGETEILICQMTH